MEVVRFYVLALFKTHIFFHRQRQIVIRSCIEAFVYLEEADILEKLIKNTRMQPIVYAAAMAARAHLCT